MARRCTWLARSISQVCLLRELKSSFRRSNQKLLWYRPMSNGGTLHRCCSLSTLKKSWNHITSTWTSILSSSLIVIGILVEPSFSGADFTCTAPFSIIITRFHSTLLDQVLKSSMLVKSLPILEPRLTSSVLN